MQVIIKKNCWSGSGAVTASDKPQNIPDKDALELINAGAASPVDADDYFQTIKKQNKPLEKDDNIYVFNNLNSENYWQEKSYAIVSLLAGKRQCFDQWLDWLMTADMPANTSLYILDNSPDCDFEKLVYQAISKLQSSNRFRTIHYQLNLAQLPSCEWAVSVHVARLYNDVLKHVTEDLILTLEDDVIPPKNGFKSLNWIIQMRHNAGAVAGAYESRHSKGKLTASYSDDFSTDRVTVKECDGAVKKVNCLALGFTLFNGNTLRKCLPLTHLSDKGFDARMSRDIAKQGNELLLYTTVFCEHLYNSK